MEEKISIAMTTFNGARYLREQLDSIYHQTRLPDEVIVSDDHSTDETAVILEEYHNAYGLIYHINPVQLGYNRNFFQVMGMCHGDYICLSDQDDIWHPDKIALSLKKMQQIENGPTLITTQVRDVDGDGIPLKTQSAKLFSTREIDTLIFDGYNQGCTMMFNQSLLKVVLSSQPLHDLYYYDVTIAAIAISVGIKYNLPDITMDYRRHMTNAVGRLDHPILNWRNRALTRPRYHHLCSDDRLRALGQIYATIKPIILNENAICIYHICQQLFQSNHLVQGLFQVKKLPDIQIKEVIIIWSYSIINAILKKFV